MSKVMRTSRRSCLQKVGYASQDDATAQAELHAAKYGGERVAYLCNFGGHYHITSAQTPKEAPND